MVAKKSKCVSHTKHGISNMFLVKNVYGGRFLLVEGMGAIKC